MSQKVDTSYQIEYLKLNFSLQMLEELKGELPFLLKQYLRKKGKATQKILSKLDEETKSEFDGMFYSVDEMKNIMMYTKKGEHLPPLSLSDSKVWTLRKMLQLLPMSYIFDGFIREMCLVYLIAEFESFLGNVIKVTFKKCPKSLSSSKKSLTNEEIVKLAKKDILHFLSEKEISNVLISDIEDISEYFETKFKIRLSEYVSDWNEFKERFYRRNILLHNSGIVNEKYRQKTGYKGEEKRISVAEDYLETSINLFRQMSFRITSEFYKKFVKGE